MNTVFVYGSLKRGGRLDMSNMPGATFISEATTVGPDYRMVSLDLFPGVLTGGDKHVVGEVWSVNDEAMRQLDIIEGYPTFYMRQLVETTAGVAWMYYLTHDMEYYEDCPRVVECEDFVAWMP